MKITTNKENLLRAVSLASHLATTRATLPILQNIHLISQKDKLLLRSTDLDQTIEVSVEADVTEEGQTTSPARLLLDYLQNNSDSEITLETNDVELVVSSVNHKAKLKGISAEEYPKLPEIHTTQSVSLPVSQVKEAITRTIFASASDDTRPVLNSLLWRFSSNAITIVGTDGYRLGRYVINHPVKDFEADVIIPKKTMQELLKIADSGGLTIDFAPSQARFTASNVSLISRLLDGTFPAFEGIIPKQPGFSVVVESSTLSQSLRLSSLFSRDSAFSTTLKLDKNKMVVSAISPHLGESSNEVLLEKAVDEPFSISLNAQYLIEALSSLSGKITLKFIDNKSPVVVEDPAKPEYLYLLMPLRSN